MILDDWCILKMPKIACFDFDVINVRKFVIFARKAEINNTG